jgi:uncharacterized damage-inducible protein DinB
VTQYAPLDITPMWSRVNDDLIRLVDLVPEDKMDWSPKPELWNARGILIHVCFGRYMLMQGLDGDTVPVPDVLREGQTREGLKEQLRLSWRRLDVLLTSPERLAAEFDINVEAGTARLNGNWTAVGLLEHDIHHRADILHYLALLGIDHPEPDAVAAYIKEQVT